MPTSLSPMGNYSTQTAVCVKWALCPIQHHIFSSTETRPQLWMTRAYERAHVAVSMHARGLTGHCALKIYSDLRSGAVYVENMFFKGACRLAKMFVSKDTFWLIAHKPINLALRAHKLRYHCFSAVERRFIWLLHSSDPESNVLQLELAFIQMMIEAFIQIKRMLIVFEKGNDGIPIRAL
jgi:hypothetical protein